MVRGQVLGLKEQEFVQAAKTIGSSTKTILLSHLIPNAMGSILVTVTMLIPSAIFMEAFLGYLGIGLQPPVSQPWNHVQRRDGESSFLSSPVVYSGPCYLYYHVCLQLCRRRPEGCAGSETEKVRSENMEPILKIENLNDFVYDQRR